MEQEEVEQWKCHMTEVEEAIKRIDAGETSSSTYEELKEKFGSSGCVFCDCNVFQRDVITKEWYCDNCKALESEHLEVLNSICE